MLLIVDLGRAPALEHNEQNVEKAGCVFDDFVARRPCQERRVQLGAGHPPQRARPCGGQKVHHPVRFPRAGHPAWTLFAGHTPGTMTNRALETGR